MDTDEARRFLRDQVRVEVSEEGIPEVVAADGKRTPVTPDEWRAHGKGVTAPILAQLTQSDSTDGIDWFRNLRHQVPDGLCVMLDTTTLRNAIYALGNRTPGPLELLDLATLTTAVICFDHVIAQQAVYTDVDPLLRLGVRYLNPSSEDIQDLWSVLVLAGNETQEGAKRFREFEEAWRSFLGRAAGDVHIKPEAWASHQTSPGDWNGVPVNEYMSDVLLIPDNERRMAAQRRSEDLKLLKDFGMSVPDDDEPLEDFYRIESNFLSVQTVRTLFNHELASQLRIPYLAASFRAPIHALAIRENHARQLVIDELVGNLGFTAATKEDMEAGPYTTKFSAPFFLALVLERMREPADFWTVVEEYRSLYRPLRERLSRDHDDWDGRVGWYSRQLLQRLVSGSQAIDQGTEAVSQFTVAAASAGLGPVFGASTSLAMKILTLAYPAEFVRKCYRRWFRPELYLLGNLPREADRLRAMDRQVEKIWGTRWGKRDYRELDILCATDPVSILRPGKIQ